MPESTTEVAARDGIPQVFGVGVALFALAALTFALSRLHLGAFALWIALGLATFKAILIILFFMKLLQHHSGSRVAFLIAVAFVALLTLFVLTDVGFRFQPLVPPGPLPTGVSPLPSSLTRTPMDVRPSERGREHPDQGLEGP